MTATTDQISQYPTSIESLRNRRKWQALRAKRRQAAVAQNKKPSPDHSSLYFLVAVLLLSALGLSAIKANHEQRMISAAGCDWRSESGR